VGNTLTRRTVRPTLPPCDTPIQFGPDSAPVPDWDPEAPDGAEPVFRVPAHHADMSLAEVRRAVPQGSRRARDQLQALRAGLACPDLDDVSAKLRDKLEQFWRIHVLHASWGGEGKAPRGVSSPGRDRVCELILNHRTGKPISHTTYKRLRRWWEARGYLAIVRPGWTPDLSPGVLHGPERDHNMTQAYVLCIPRRAALTAMRRRRRPVQTENGPLSGSSKSDGSHTRAREGNPETGSFASCCYPASQEQSKRTKGSSREGALLLGALARVTDGWWAHLTRPFSRWEAASLLYAIDHYPDGSAHVGTAEQVRNPVAWLRWRLSHWLNPDGTARLSPAGEAAERARRHRERQAAEHAELGIAARADRIRADRGGEAAAPAPPPPWTPPADQARADRVIVDWAVPRYGTSPAQPERASLASLARELHRLKQAGQLDTKTRAAAVSAWETRRGAPGTPQDATEPPPPAQPPAAAQAPGQGGPGGYRPTPEYEAAVAIAAANVAAWEAARHAGAEPHGDRENAS
jgi:hypothetical protein